MATELIAVEQNVGLGNIVCVRCPTCGMTYPPMDNEGHAVPFPTDCRRCGGPMEPDKALEYGEMLAIREHNEKLTKQGRRLRGELQGDHGHCPHCGHAMSEAMEK